MFFTGFLSAVFQSRAFQAWMKRVMPSRRYWLSVWMWTRLGRFSASSAAIAAIISMRLLVVGLSAPISSRSCAP